MSKHAVMEETPIYNALDAEYMRRERGRIIQEATTKAIAEANRREESKENLAAFHYGSGSTKIAGYSGSPIPERIPTKRERFVRWLRA